MSYPDSIGAAIAMTLTLGVWGYWIWTTELSPVARVMRAKEDAEHQEYARRRARPGILMTHLWSDGRSWSFLPGTDEELSRRRV